MSGSEGGSSSKYPPYFLELLFLLQMLLVYISIQSGKLLL